VGISRKFKDKIESLSEADKDRMIRLGWEDRSTFETINRQFGFSEDEFVSFMRTQLDEKTFKRWRRRAHEQGHLKHEALRGFKVTRFKCSRQSVDGITKGWK